jgi:serine/threonine protein kinase
MNSFRSVISNTMKKLEQEARDPKITEQQRAHTKVNMEEIAAQMQAVLKKHQQLGIQHFVDDALYRDVMTEMLNSTQLQFMGRFILKGDQHEYKSATCAVFIATDVEGDTKRPVALKFMKNVSEFEQEKSSRRKLKEAAADELSAFVVDITQSFDCSHAPFKQSLNSGSNFVINSKLQEYPSLIVMPAADRNLRAIMDNERITDPAVIKSMFHDILRAVKFLHDSGVIHGDIKPRNVVRVGVEPDRRLVLIDLDASAEIGKQYSWSKYSSAYLPPEAIRMSLSLICSDFSVSDAPTSAQFTVEFNVSVPIEIPAGSSFTILFAPVKLTDVVSLILDDAVDLSSCMSIKDHVITVTAKDSLAAGSRRVKMVAMFNGNPTAVGTMSARLEHVVNSLASNGAPVSACVRRFDARIPPACTCNLAQITPLRECVGACGLANRSHDMWSLGVLLYRFIARDSLFSENDDDNIKEASDNTDHLLQAAHWDPKFKDERLQKIDDTATRSLVSQLLQKDPRDRPFSIDHVLAMPFNEMDAIKLKLEQMVKHDISRSSNSDGSVKYLRTGKFSDAARGLRSYLQVADSWDEKAACQLQGMEDEVDALKDCPDCARKQAAALLLLGRRKEASATQELATALALLRQQRHQGQDTQAAADAVKALRSNISIAKGWHYGLQTHCIEWPDTFVKTFCQPMCQRCQGYSLDYSSIVADLNYIMREAAVEQKCWNGVRDRGRAGHRLEDFMQKPQAIKTNLTKAELVALRLYTSHSYESINKPMRDMDRVGPHPLPGVVTNIQEGLKKLRRLGENDASSKQTVVLWRGMSAMKFSDEFSTEGGTELAPMSTTTDVSVAISYAIKKDTRSALLFRFVTRNNLERGADVQWLSMFPNESETLFPPLTFIQKTRSEGRVVQHNGVTVSVVELSTSLA